MSIKRRRIGGNPDLRSRMAERAAASGDTRAFLSVLAERMRSGRITTEHLVLLCRMAVPYWQLLVEAFQLPPDARPTGLWEEYRADPHEVFCIWTTPARLIRWLLDPLAEPLPRVPVTDVRLHSRVLVMQWIVWWLAAYGKPRLRTSSSRTTWQQFREEMNRLAWRVLRPIEPEDPASDLSDRAGAVSEQVELYSSTAQDGDPRNHFDIYVPVSMISGCWDEDLDDYDTRCLDELDLPWSERGSPWPPEPFETVVHSIQGDTAVLRGYIPHELFDRDFMADFVPALEAHLRGDL